jgi:dolichyl-phosphate beta-glucosyltransferase
MKLSIIIPAYNEEKRIVGTLRSIGDYLEKQDYEYEILVIENGSTDKTAEVVKEMFSEVKGLRLEKGSSGKGKGFAVRKGMLVAKGDFRIFVDADNSTPIEQIEKMWPLFEKGFNVVIGSRNIKGAVLDPPQPWYRKTILGEGFKIYRKIIIGLWDIKDTQCGFKCFDKESVEKVFPKCRINDFAFDPEVLILCRKYGYKIKEVPIYWKNDLDSKVKLKSVIKMAIDMFKVRLNLIKRVYGRE